MAAVLKYTLVVRDQEGNAVALLAGQPVPAWAKGLVHRDDLDGDVDGSSDEVKGLSDLKKDELQAEIDRRNADRDDESKIVPEGSNKPDLLKALEDDDANSDDESDEDDSDEDADENTN